MRAKDFLLEGKNHPIIVVDVQPEYCNLGFQDTCSDIIQFVNDRTGLVLMFVNAEDSGVSEDSISSIKEFWEEDGFDPDRWSDIEIVDKGFGHLRSWMDEGIDPAIIVKVIRKMYQEKVTDSRELFSDADDYNEAMQEFTGLDDFDFDDPLSVEWTSVAQLKKFNGAYIVGGGREECLREVELLMNAFNIKYKRIDSLVYG